MPLIFELLDGLGERIWMGGELDDSSRNRLPDVDYEKYPTLAGIDRFGSTSFNDRQMGFLADELESLLRSDRLQPGATAIVGDIVSACRQGATHAHWRLEVTGD